jgi:hypothetical protein
LWRINDSCLELGAAIHPANATAYAEPLSALAEPVIPIFSAVYNTFAPAIKTATAN